MCSARTHQLRSPNQRNRCRNVAWMRMLRLPLAALAITCSVLGACGSDKPAASVGNTSVEPPTLGYAGGDGASSGGDATQPAQAAGNADCTALKTNLEQKTSGGSSTKEAK